MSDERQASERTPFDYLLNAFEMASQANEPAKEGYAEKRNALYRYVRALEADRALLEVADRAYVAADFAYPQYERRTCLILVLPEGALAGVDLRKTLSSSPLAPTQEGA